MNIKELINTLHPLERKILPFLKQGQTVHDLINLSGMQEVEILRALHWLENKDVLHTKSTLAEFVSLDKNGEQYAKTGLPECILLHFLKKGSCNIAQIKSQTNLDDEELQAAVGALRKRMLILFDSDKKIGLTPAGLSVKELMEDQFLSRLLRQGPVDISTLLPHEKHALELLKKRKEIIKCKIIKKIEFTFTEVGRELLSVDLIFENVIDSITPGMLAQGGWKNKTFRSYDVVMNVPQLNFGRRHHYLSFLDDVRKRFIALGFTEMSGPLVESEFWDMDALFMPQFHSARDIHQAYYIKEPAYGEVDPKILKRVKEAHENGGIPNSKGWKYRFDVQRTKQLLLRTQGTACSARMLASKNLMIPGKYFGIAKCFRYDVIDATHLPDFFQTEGIVVEEGLNFQHLKGLLKLFAEEFAKTSDIRVKPGYFPFTEPSCELYAKHPELGWIELGGAGIFRPELTSALGVSVPVIAWGLGIDRIGMFNMGVKDIRTLYTSDLSILRNIKVV
ncbi:MAG: phenylalanine--tRNA ligase subunit alpha [Nanoarchaeota archaeon]